MVFIEEQGVAAEIERDGLDDEATHALALHDGRVVATGRFVVQDGTVARVGRMAVLAPHRRQGLGSALLEALEAEARRQHLRSVELHSQAYVRRFYEERGYRAEGQPFVEAGIDHVTMVKHL